MEGGVLTAMAWLEQQELKKTMEEIKREQEEEKK